MKIECLEAIDLSIDMECMNFVYWFASATPDEILRAWETKPKELERLLDKYRSDVQLMGMISGKKVSIGDEG